MPLHRPASLDVLYRDLRLVASNGSAPSVDRSPSTTLWAMLDMVDDAMVAVGRDGVIRHINSAAPEMFGAGPERLVGSPLAVLIPDGARAAHAQHVAGFADSGERMRRMSARVGVSCRRIDGSEFPADVSIFRIDHEGEVLLLALVRDVSERHDLSRRIDWLSGHDPVTGLANRAGMLQVLAERISVERAEGSDVEGSDAEAPRDATSGESSGVLLGTVLLVDIEGFGFINHAYGTAVGDRVLQAVAQRLSRFSGHGPTSVARLGDDEFVVYLPEVTDDAALRRCAHRLVEHLERPVTVDEDVIEIRVAIGARSSSTRPTTATEVITHAAAALAEGRARGERRPVTFDEQVRTRSSERVQMLNDLWVAIERDQLWLAYQPIVDAWTGRPRSAEALLRWRHPTLGDVSPDVFVPLAEQTDLIEQLSRWVLQRAARQIAEWGDEDWFIDDFRVAVNISARQLRGRSVIDDIRNAVHGASIAPSRLRVEVTETAAMEDLAVGIDVLAEIGALGVSLALDDFGTGYSSLARFGRLPIDEIKIDRSFVADVDSDPAPRAIVDAVLAIAHVFGVTAVAEGVERLEQLRVLRDLGCTLIQGWFFAAAQAPDDFAVTAATLARRAEHDPRTCEGASCVESRTAGTGSRDCCVGAAGHR